MRWQSDVTEVNASALRLQEAWGYVFMVNLPFVWGSLGYIWKTTQEMYIKYYYLGTPERS